MRRVVRGLSVDRFQLPFGIGVRLSGVVVVRTVRDLHRDACLINNLLSQRRPTEMQLVGADGQFLQLGLYELEERLRAALRASWAHARGVDVQNHRDGECWW